MATVEILPAMRKATRLDLAQITPKSILRIAGGIDSLTDGAGSPVASSFDNASGNSLIERLKALYGDAGKLVAIDTGNGYYAGNSGSGGGSLQNETPVTAGLWDGTNRKTTLFGKGWQFNSASGGYWAGLTPGIEWTYARVWFRLGSGGSFSLGQMNTAESSAINAQAISSTTHTVGSLQSAVIFRDTSTSTSQRIGASPVNGTVTFYHAEFYTGNAGVFSANCAVGGTTLQQHASLDDTYARQWWRALSPDLYVMNGGMNDRNGSSLPAVVGWMETLVDRIKSTGKTDVLLMRSNDPSSTASLIASYDKAWKSLALGRACGYFDVRTLAGFTDYATANGAGNMYDTVHPSVQGCGIIGGGLFGVVTP